MLHWLGLAALAGAAAVAVRWYLTRVDSLGRTRSFPWISTILLVLIGVATLTPWVLRLRLEARLSDAASQIVGTRVEVDCQSFGEAFVDAGGELGYVAFGPDGIPEKRTLIKRDQCNDLSAYVGSDKLAPEREHVVAVHVLTHEAIHMTGVTNEADTECIAVQRDAEMARALGASPEAAQALATYYWTNIYPRMPSDYRSDECAGP